MLRTLRTLKSHRFLLCLVAAALLLAIVIPGVALRQDAPDTNASALALYKGGGNGATNFTLLSTSGGAHEVIAGSKYLGENTRRFERELQRQGGLKVQLDDAQSDLRKEQAKAEDAQRVAADERDHVTQLRTQADGEPDQATAAEQQDQPAIAG